MRSIHLPRGPGAFLYKTLGLERGLGPGVFTMVFTANFGDFPYPPPYLRALVRPGTRGASAPSLARVAAQGNAIGAARPPHVI